MWQGAKALLLTEYFENKEKLNELKSMRNYLSRKRDIETEKHYDKEISEIENKILEFISGLDNQHLKSIIYMSLDMEVEIGYPDKVMNWLIYVKKKGRDCMSNRPSYYRNDEIKYKIDTAIQMVMFEKGKENWDTLLEVQDKLYDEFGLSIE